MPKHKWLHAIKPVNIEEHDVRHAHPIVTELRDIAVRYHEVEQQLEYQRKRHKPPQAKYDMSCHFVASNEFYVLLKLSNTQEFLDYIAYWLRGPHPDEVIHSVTYRCVVDGDVVTLIDGTRGIGVLRAPMYIERDVFDRFLVTKMPYSGWILTPVLNRCVSGIDYSDKDVLYAGNIEDRPPTMSVDK